MMPRQRCEENDKTSETINIKPLNQLFRGKREHFKFYNITNCPSKKTFKRVLQKLILLFQFYNMTDNVQLINRCKEELSEEIEYNKLKDLPSQITVYMLFNGFNELSCNKSYFKELKRVFRTKRNILKNMQND